MRTSKPFSTISYNTDAFLQEKLKAFATAGILDFWAYIEHMPEEDEKKAHKHLFCVPSKLMETNGTFKQNLLEVDHQKPLAKPLGIINCVSSKFSDWYFYTLHDVNYLASKGQKRKYQYNDSNYSVSCQDYFKELKNQIDYSKVRRQELIAQAAEDGESFVSIVKRGLVPVPLINQYRTFFDIITGKALEDYEQYRAERYTHTPKE